MFLQMLQNMLKAMPNLQVEASARTRAEAIAACEKYHPDLLVLDLDLPDGEGIAVARRLARLKPSAKTIVLSGEASTFICPAELQANVHAVLDKTQAFDDLAVQIRLLLSRARGSDSPPQRVGIRENLSMREYEIFVLIGRGLLSKEIGEVLGISTHTVQTHRKNIAEKLGTSGAELVQRALRHYHETLGASS